MSSDTGSTPVTEDEMSLDVHRHEQGVVITVAGEVDSVTAPRLGRSLDGVLATAAGVVVVDLVRVTFLASTGLSALLDAHRATGPGSPLRVVVDHARPVIRPIQITGLDAVLTLFDSVEDALRGRPELDVATER